MEEYYIPGETDYVDRIMWDIDFSELHRGHDIPQWSEPIRTRADIGDRGELSPYRPWQFRKMKETALRRFQVLPEQTQFHREREELAEAETLPKHFFDGLGQYSTAEEILSAIRGGAEEFLESEKKKYQSVIQMYREPQRAQLSVSDKNILYIIAGGLALLFLLKKKRRL